MDHLQKPTKKPKNVFISFKEPSHQQVIFLYNKKYLMQKSGRCRCGVMIKIPKTECLYSCANCNQKGVFLCHIIPDPANPVFMRCKQCNINYTLFECPQCNGTSVIKQFASGHVYGCVCGFTANLVSCNICTSLLCMPPKANCQKITIDCKKCNNKFKYRVCQVCGECNYMTGDGSSEQCFNEKCKLYGVSGFSQGNNQPVGAYSGAVVGNANNNSNPYATIQIANSQQESINNVKCKICRNGNAIMINTTCFHLSVCQLCVDQLSLDRCPVCQAKGQYRKVQI